MDRYNEKVFAVSIWDKNVDDVIRAVGCKTRRDILRILVGNPMSIMSIAESLNVAVSTVSEHINALLKTGIISVIRNLPDRGRSKIVALQYEKLELDFSKEPMGLNKGNYTVQIPIGSYNSFKINSLCGMIGTEGYLSPRDNVESFYSPLRAVAQLIWFDYGYLEYVIPVEKQKVDNVSAVSFSLEICSEAPIYNEDWKSDIYFEINGKRVCVYTCPGDFGLRRGLFTPEWWNGTQYGLLKKVEVREDGSYLDGERVSEVCLSDICSQEFSLITLRIGVDEKAVNRGGINIFGKKFGDHNQHIVFSLSHKNKSL